jgi:EmrB/QacA subfamily drug resistance transporter
VKLFGSTSPASPPPARSLPGLPPTARSMRLLPLIVACGLFMENLDSTVIATALPQIAHSLGSDPIRLSLAITTYLLSLAVFIPVSGWFADRFGARTIFCLAILVFTAGSILCGLSNDLPELSAARALQGSGGAMMVPVGRLVLLRSVPKSELIGAMAYLTVPALIGPVLGPPLGGFLATYASWRWIFFINVPLGIVGIALAWRFIENHRETEPPPLDLVGFLLTAVGLSGLVLGFEFVGRDAVPLAAALGLTAVGATATALYVAHARGHHRPLIDLSLFRFPTFAIAISGGTLFRTGIGALPFLLPLMLQLGFGMTAFAAGLLTFMSAVGALAMKLTARSILRHFGYRTVLVANAILSAAFLIAYGGFHPDTSRALIMALLLAGGFFRSLQFTSINTLAFAEVPAQRMSGATSLSSTAQQLSASTGIGVGALMLHLTVHLRGGASVSAADFWPAFAVIGLVSAASALIFARLTPDAGAELTGYAARPARFMRRSSASPAGAREHEAPAPNRPHKPAR